MCWPGPTGGPCCAAVARQKLHDTNEASPAWDEAAATYSATSEGHTHLSGLLNQAHAHGNHPLVDRYTKALRHGAHTIQQAQIARTRRLASQSTACEDQRPFHAA